MLSALKYALGGLFAKQIAPKITPNTFFVWEPCSHSHAEVIPGFVKYLLDLGFDVCVFMTPERMEEGLFSRFRHERLTVNPMRQPAIVAYFKKHGLSGAKGILITTARKIGHKKSYRTEQSLFHNRSSRQRLLLVEHDIKATTDHGALGPDIITLRQVNYKDAQTTPVNPHFFGDVEITGKSSGPVNFITVGALRAKRRNTAILMNAVAALHGRGIDNFKITVIGRGDLQGIAPELRKYFDVKGRVHFTELYSELERADFFLTLLDPDNLQHERYLTTGTSGNFQLILGFAKPCLIESKFAAPNRFSAENSVIYTGNDALAAAMRQAIEINGGDYSAKQRALQALAADIYSESLANMKRLTQDS